MIAARTTPGLTGVDGARASLSPDDLDVAVFGDEVGLAVRVQRSVNAQISPLLIEVSLVRLGTLAQSKEEEHMLKLLPTLYSRCQVIEAFKAAHGLGTSPWSPMPG